MRLHVTKTVFLSALYRRIGCRRGAKRAAMAVAHRILVIIYHVLEDQSPYREYGETFPMNNTVKLPKNGSFVNSNVLAIRLLLNPLLRRANFSPRDTIKVTIFRQGIGYFQKRQSCRGTPPGMKKVE